MSKNKKRDLPHRPCVGIMVLNAENKVWTGHRMVESSRELSMTDKRWQMPQGGVDPGEDTHTAALRELGEETGINPDLVTVIAESDSWIPYDLPHDLVPRLWKGRYRGQEQKWFLLRFHGADADVNIATKHAEFSSWRWLPTGQLLDSIVPFKREVYRQVLAEFEDKI